MERYKNRSGDSGIVAYEIGGDYVKVQFHDGAIYIYNYQSAGKDNVEQMKKLAVSGERLNSFINRTVKKQYAVKLSQTA